MTKNADPDIVYKGGMDMYNTSAIMFNIRHIVKRLSSCMSYIIKTISMLSYILSLHASVTISLIRIPLVTDD